MYGTFDLLVGADVLSLNCTCNCNITKQVNRKPS